MITFKQIFDNGLNEVDLWREIEYRQKTGSPLFCLIADYATDDLQELFQQSHNYDIEELKRGYIIVESGIGATHVEKIDDLNAFPSDVEASLQAERDGYNFIKDLNVGRDHQYWDLYLDTPENRQILRSYGLI